MIVRELTIDQLAVAVLQYNLDSDNDDEGGSPTADDFVYDSWENFQECTGVSPDNDVAFEFPNLDIAKIIEANPNGEKYRDQAQVEFDRKRVRHTICSKITIEGLHVKYYLSTDEVNKIAHVLSKNPAALKFILEYKDTEGDDSEILELLNGTCVFFKIRKNAAAAFNIIPHLIF